MRSIGYVYLLWVCIFLLFLMGGEGIMRQDPSSSRKETREEPLAPGDFYTLCESCGKKERFLDLKPHGEQIICNQCIKRGHRKKKQEIEPKNFEERREIRRQLREGTTIGIGGKMTIHIRKKPS